MTSRKKKNKVVILCEDITHERFIYQYLVERGFSKRDIEDFGNPKGRMVEENNASVIQYYPSLVKSYRRKNYNKNRVVIVMIDGDNKGVNGRKRDLNIALDEQEGKLNRDIRLPDEKIAIFVPNQNIETWFYYLSFDKNCDEEIDYKKEHPEINKMNKTDKIELAEASAKKLAREICPQGLDSNAPSSLQDACSELQRILD